MEREDNKLWWKQKLEQGKVAPAEQVWQNIAGALDKQEVENLKRRIVYFRWMSAAAACLLICISVSAYMYMQKQEQENKALLQKLAVLNDAQKRNEATWLINSTNATSQNTNVENADKSGLSITSNKEREFTGNTKNANGNNNGLKQAFTQPRVKEKTSKPFLPSFFANHTRTENVSVFKDNTESSGSFFQTEMLISGNLKSRNDDKESNVIEKDKDGVNYKIELPMAMVKADKAIAEAERNADEKEKKKDNKEKFWTAVGVSAGSFNNVTPTHAGSSTMAFRSSLAGQTASDESNSPGYTYAVNVGIGAKISKRWLLQGGVSYLSQISEYTANSVVGNTPNFQVASVNQLSKNRVDESTEILATTPYAVTNAIELISFPVQAGYIVFENKWAMQINTGFATDLFLQSTQTPNAKNVEASTTGRGSDSPYRAVNFAGLLGSEISYRFAENYRISVSPGLRYPLQSIYKDQVAVKSTPLTFDVALRFRYIFN
ncbi:MAG: hypothetical protein MUF68_00930 [Cyclobacteriaceae bacterium]|jgi:hypothetical protein|nr:hypothetical protein [Cyclobacteriaceae bacterium]